MEYKRISLGGYNLHLIKTEKFKTCHLEVIFHNNVEVENITKRQFLTKILAESNKTYPTNRKLHLKLEDLYGASFYSFTSKVGNGFITNFVLEFLDPEYTDKTVFKEAVKLLFDIILNPLVSISEFDNKTFNIVKERLRDSINSAIEEPNRLAMLNALKHLGNIPSAYSNLGNIDDLEEITPNNLYEYYEKMIRNDYIDIFVVGNLDMEEIAKSIIEYAKFNIIKNHLVNLHVTNLRMKEKSYVDSTRSVQSNIVVILSLNNLTKYEERYVANLYNNILGQNPLQNKLFRKLREENSLCYSVSSYYQKYDGLILINTGVDRNDTNKAIKLIKEAIKEMSNRISSEELDNAKEQIVASLNYAKDNVDRIIDNYFYQSINELDDIETRIATFKKVTKEEIYALNKKISINIVYTLEGNENEKD